MLEELVLPAMSVASTPMVFSPPVRGTSQEKVEAEREAGLPLQSTVAIPLRESAAVPVTLTGEMLTDEPFAGEVIAMLGAVLSRLTVSVADAVLPARSAAVPLTSWFAPSVVTVIGAGQLATPEVLSTQVKLTVTSLWFQPARLGWGVIVGDNVGGVLSMLSVTEVLAVFPARSTAVPETTWFAVSVLTVIGAGQLATPDSLSEQAKLTVTSLLCQPAALGAGFTTAAIVGGVVSTRNRAPNLDARLTAS